MNKRFKTFFSITIVLIILGVLTYNYIYQSHRDIENEKALFAVNTEDISSSFSKNTTKAETIYLNNTIEVSGFVSESNSNSITLDDKVFCQFTNNLDEGLALNSDIKIKGRVIGYDDLLEQVKLDQCSIIKH